MTRSQRKLTAVMFTDVVGYSAMVNRDERQARALLDMHRKLLGREVAQWRGRHIDNIGDGTLTIFDSALDAAECAVSIQHALRQRNATAAPEAQLRIRIGLHQGDVERGREGLFGDGVNVCARLEPLSPAGGIAMSSMVRAQVHGPLREYFRSAGEQALKNIAEPVEVFKLVEADVAAAASQLGPPPRRPWRLRVGLPLAGAAALLLGLSGAAWIGLRAPPAAEAASLAVLPLENLATEPGTAELVAGLHDSLITEIARTPHLKVISRSSVMRFAQQRASIPEVAKLLGVANVLEGSVQRVGSRLRVNVQLIDAKTDEHIWAEVYDRNFEDLFDVQTEISREIARKIQGNLALPSMAESERPTKSSDAYVLYLRAIAREDNDPILGSAPPEEPLRLLEQAVALDPEFALAHAAIARYAAWGARWAQFSDQTRVEGYVTRAQQAAQRAIKLKPQLPEALLAVALANYWKDRDPVAAERDFTRALAARPGDANALYILSGIYGALGDFEHAVDTVHVLLDVDPANEKAYEQLTDLLQRLRRYDEAERAYARWLQFSETPAYVKYLSAQLQFYLSGNLAPLKQIASGPNDEAAGLTMMEEDRWQVAMYEGRYADAAAAVQPGAAEFLAGHGNDYFWALYLGEALQLDGKGAAAGPYLEAVARYFRPQLAARANDHALLANLALTESLLGDHAAAAAGFAHALRQVAPKAGYRPSGTYYDYLTLRAQAAARAGDRNAALADLDVLLREPSNLHAQKALRDPMWGALGGDAEFQKRVRAGLPAG